MSLPRLCLAAAVGAAVMSANVVADDDAPLLACGASELLVRTSDSVKLVAGTSSGRTSGEFLWAVTAGTVAGHGKSVTWSLKGAPFDKNSQTAIVSQQMPDGSRAYCSVEVWMTNEDSFRLGRETGRAYLLRDQGSERGLGLYSYLLFGGTANEISRSKYESVARAYLEMISPLTALQPYFKNALLNALYVPVIELPPSNFNRFTIEQQVSWLLKAYDYARARAWLDSIPGVRREGIYVTTANAPQPNPAMTVELDLSSVPGSAANLWVKEYLTMTAQERSWSEPSVRLFMLKARTLLAVVSGDTIPARDALEKWVTVRGLTGNVKENNQ